MIKESKAIGLINLEYNKSLKIAKTKTTKQYLNHKLKHTFKVYDTFEHILINNKNFKKTDIIESVDTIKYIKLAYLLHDIGRFNQIDTQKGGIISNQNYDHGDGGYNLLKKYGISDPKILLPVRYHNNLLFSDIKKDEDYKSLKKTTQKDIFYIGHAIRDIDKLENMKTFILQQGFYNEREEKILGFKLKEKNELSSTILKTFLNGGLIKSKDIQTVVDKIFFYYSWCNDIFYPSSMEYLKSIGFKSFIINLLVELKIPSIQIEKIKNKKISSIYEKTL